MPEVIINGPEGRLECRYMPAADPNAPTALILHPEPDRGGTMNNRVTFATYKLLQERGFSVMRFNFRGVGRSQGSYDKGEGELSMRPPQWIGCKPSIPALMNAGLLAFHSAHGLACDYDAPP